MLLEKLPIEHANFINQANKQGRTPLMWAVIGNSVEGVQYLLKNGADISVKSLEGKTAYDYAMEKGYTDLAELIKP
jgi:ankyrin repeat protein